MNTMRVEATSIPILPVASSVEESVATQHTPVTVAQMRAAIAKAYQTLNGHAPPPGTVDILTAQAALETGNGTKMNNFNFGGIKGHSPSGQTAHYMTREVLNGKSVHLQQGFRAYRSLDEGAIDFVSTLQSHFGGAMAQAQRGSIDGFAGALKSAGYYTASESEYASALHALAPSVSSPTALQAIDTSTVGASSAGANFPTSDTVARVLDAVAASTGRIASPTEDA